MRRRRSRCHRHRRHFVFANPGIENGGLLNDKNKIKTHGDDDGMGWKSRNGLSQDAVKQ